MEGTSIAQRSTMSEYTSGHAPFGSRESDRDPLHPLTHGRAFVADHHRFWGHDEDEFVTPEALAALHKAVDRLVIVDDLPVSTEVDPSLLASIAPYPPLRSRLPLPTINEVIGLVQSIHGSEPKNSQKHLC
jgi:hypothetical protein